MLLIDRYIVRQFLINFLILLVVFMLLFVLADLIIDADEFVKAGEQYALLHGGSRFAGTLRAIGGYYPPMIALMYVYISGVLVVAAMGFTFANLVRTREIMVLVASGVNMYRIAMPVLLVGCALNLLNIVNQELLIPPLADRLTIGKSDLSKRETRKQPVWFVRDGAHHLFSAAHFDVSRQMLSELVILGRDAQGGVVSRTTASQAFWNAQRQGWDLILGQTEQFAAIGADQGSSPPDARGLPEVTFIASDLTPQVLLARRESIYPRLLSLAALRKLRSNPSVDKNQIRQIMHARFSLVVVNVLVLALGMPFFLRLDRSKLYVNAVRAAAVCLLAWGAGLMMLQLGGSAVNPVLAAWLPVVIYLPLTFIFMQTVRT